MTPVAAPSRALTIVERVERSPAVLMLDARSQALVELLPDAAAATRFRRVVIQALAKNPELLECTPESVVLSVFEAATQGLEPTGAAGGAHLVPYRKKVAKNPDRWETQAQLIPDYRGVVRLVTRPHDDKGRLVASDVAAIEARVVKEGDEFSWTEGIAAAIQHVPSLLAGRSETATTHVYAIGRLANGQSVFTVMDRAEIERIRKRGREASFSPWATDWDEMAKKTVVKRLSKLLPVRPEVRSILVREDELEGASRLTEVTAGPPPSGSKVSRLTQRLAAAPAPVATPAPEPEAAEEGSFVEVPTEPAAEPSLADAIRAAAIADGRTERASKEAVAEVLATTFRGWQGELVQDGIRVLFGDAAVNHPKAGQVAALKAIGDAMPGPALVAAWRTLIDG